MLHNIHKDAFFLPFVMVRDEMSCSFTLTIPAQKDMLETKLESEIHSKERKRETMSKQITAIIVGAGHEDSAFYTAENLAACWRFWTV